MGSNKEELVITTILTVALIFKHDVQTMFKPNTVQAPVDLVTMANMLARQILEKSNEK